MSAAEKGSFPPQRISRCDLSRFAALFLNLAQNFSAESGDASFEAAAALLRSAGRRPEAEIADERSAVALLGEALLGKLIETIG